MAPCLQWSMGYGAMVPCYHSYHGHGAHHGFLGCKYYLILIDTVLREYKLISFSMAVRTCILRNVKVLISPPIIRERLYPWRDRWAIGSAPDIFAFLIRMLFLEATLIPNDIKDYNWDPNQPIWQYPSLNESICSRCSRLANDSSTSTNWHNCHSVRLILAVRASCANWHLFPPPFVGIAAV